MRPQKRFGFPRLLALLLPVFIMATAVAAQARSLPSQTPLINPTSSRASIDTLLLTLTTRPGLTSLGDTLAMVPAARAGALAFERELRQESGWPAFSRQLPTLARQLDGAIRTSAAGLRGAQARAAALDRFYAALIVAADRAAIPFDRLDLAFLSALAAFEAELARPPAARALTLPERELVELLLINSARQVRVRTMFASTLRGFELLNVDPALTERYRLNMGPWLEYILSLMSVRFEEELMDPLIVADTQALRQQIYNTLAQFDLLMLKYSLELYWINTSPNIDLSGLAQRMEALGGVMAGMTAERLLQSGLFDSPIYHGLPLFIAFDALRPEQALSYRPDPELTQKLVDLGGTVPTPPDFSILGNPYLAVAELNYDLNLCMLIYWEEMRRIEDQAWSEDLVMNLQDYFALRQALFSRLQQVFARLNGASSQQMQAYRYLLNKFYW